MPEQNHRKRQIVAGHMARKAHERGGTQNATERQLWDYVSRALEEHERSSIFAGHSQNASKAAFAIEALRELKLRGTQLQLNMGHERRAVPLQDAAGAE